MLDSLPFMNCQNNDLISWPPSVVITEVSFFKYY